MDQVSCKAMMSNDVLLAVSSDSKSFSSVCLLIRLCVLKLARMGFDELAKFEMRAGMSYVI